MQETLCKSYALLVQASYVRAPVHFLCTSDALTSAENSKNQCKKLYASLMHFLRKPLTYAPLCTSCAHLMHLRVQKDGKINARNFMQVLRTSCASLLRTYLAAEWCKSAEADRASSYAIFLCKFVLPGIIYIYIPVVR